MNYHHINERRTMYRIYIFFTFLLSSVGGTGIIDHNDCNYVYDAKCYSTHHNLAEFKFGAVESLCSVDDLIDDVKYTIQSFPGENPTTSDIIKVNFTLPNTECRYKVALLVNSSVKNDEDCKNHMFHQSNAHEEEVHTVEKSVCVVPFSNQSSLNNCKKNTFFMWYEHIFTGCYALRFADAGYRFSVFGNQYITTSYIRTEVSEPKFRCRYEYQIGAAPSKPGLTTFLLSVSVHTDTAGMNLTLLPISYPDENEANGCAQYSKEPLSTWYISTVDRKNRALRNCTHRKGSEIGTRETECEFWLRAPHDVDYCLKIQLQDERCYRETIWNPPPDGKEGEQPCIWLQRCNKIVKKLPTPSAQSFFERARFLPIIMTVIIVTTIIVITTHYVCRAYHRTLSPVYSMSNLGDLQISGDEMEAGNFESTDEENAPQSPLVANDEDTEESEPIVLLYPRGTSLFMKFMSDFRTILKARCHCCIRDWYDPKEWDEVARIGACSWVTDLLRNKHRVIWFDIPRARRLFGGGIDEFFVDAGQSTSEKDKAEEQIVSDFRDAALPAVLAMAKRSVVSSEYNTHFVVRLEGFPKIDRLEEDPFEVLSPYTRYLIPHHLSELCFHLSSPSMKVGRQKSLRADKALLRGSLARVENNS